MACPDVQEYRRKSQGLNKPRRGRRPKYQNATPLPPGPETRKDSSILSSREKEIITGGSEFNIKAESLRLGGFTREQTAVPFRQHSEETGQDLTREAPHLIWELTCGQSWLVNALGYEA